MSNEYAQSVADELRATIKGVAGEGDWFSDPAPLKALWYAIDNLGNAQYGSDIDGVNKCNSFVYHSYMTGAGVLMPDRRKEFLKSGTQYFAANTFADPSKRLDYFQIVTEAKPGDVIAFHSPGPNGHMTIKVASGLLIYASRKDVKLGTFGMNTTGHDGFVIRHYTGK